MTVSYSDGIEVEADPHDAFATRYVVFGGLIAGTWELISDMPGPNWSARSTEAGADAIAVLMLINGAVERRFVGPDKTQESIHFINDEYARWQQSEREDPTMTPTFMTEVGAAFGDPDCERDIRAVRALIEAGYVLSEETEIAHGLLHMIVVPTSTGTGGDLFRIDSTCDIASLPYPIVIEPFFRDILRTAGVLDETESRLKERVCLVRVQGDRLGLGEVFSYQALGDSAHLAGLEWIAGRLGVEI